PHSKMASVHPLNKYAWFGLFLVAAFIAPGVTLSILYDKDHNVDWTWLGTGLGLILLGVIVTVGATQLWIKSVLRRVHGEEFEQRLSERERAQADLYFNR